METENGMWVISYDEPKEPFFIVADTISKYVRIEAPTAYIRAFEKFQCGCLTKAQQKRLELIQPLLNDEKYIFDRLERTKMIKKIAEDAKTTPKRIRRILYRFWATGELIQPKEINTAHKGQFDDDLMYAIKNIYFSARNISLRGTHSCLIFEKYTDENGNLIRPYPSFSCMKSFFYSHNMHKLPQKNISRNGLSYYQRNCRILYGSATKWREKIGSYQIDATEADIYLVSRFTGAVIGRPFVYLAVDTATELIAGIYVGLDSGARAALACIYNAVIDKVSFCLKYGIEIEAWQWPSRGMPIELITDKGSEFASSKLDLLCERYGVIIQSLPPFRPDGKGLVERAFGLLQEQYLPFVQGKGAIREDAQERWSVDYRGQAVLTIDDYMRMLIQCIIYVNSVRVLSNYSVSKEMAQDMLCATPAGIWKWLSDHQRNQTMEIDENELKVFVLPREIITVSRRGIICNGLLYSQKNMESLGFRIGDKYEAAYDTNDTSRIYVLNGTTCIEVPIAPSAEQFAGLSVYEYEQYRNWQKEQCSRNSENELQGRVQLTKEIKKIVDNEKRYLGKQDGAKIKNSRNEEKEKRS